MKMKKHNFANVMMPLNGINIQLSQIGSQKKAEQNKFCASYPDSIRFDSHFESGNLLYAYRKDS